MDDIDYHVVAVYVGCSIVFLTHIFTIGSSEARVGERFHAYLNLLAVLAIVYFALGQQGLIGF